MHAAQVMRTPLATLDYSEREDETEVVVPLSRRLRTRPRAESRPGPALAQSRMPLIVDKDQLVEIMRVMSKAPPRVKPRVRRLSELVVDARSMLHRQQRQRAWMMRIGVVVMLDLAAFVATRL